MLVPLATRPDLTLIVIVGIAALMLFFYKMAEDVQRGVEQPTSQDRRNLLESLMAIIVTMFLLAYTLPDAISTMSKESCWLTIEDNQTYQISSGETEEYCGIECNGVLNLNGTVEVNG